MLESQAVPVPRAWILSVPRPLYPCGKRRWYPPYGGLSEFQSRCGWFGEERLLPTPEIKHQYPGCVQVTAPTELSQLHNYKGRAGKTVSTSSARCLVKRTCAKDYTIVSTVRNLTTDANSVVKYFRNLMQLLHRCASTRYRHQKCLCWSVPN
jgi:hypothetical protein